MLDQYTDTTAATINEEMTFLFGAGEKPKIPQRFVQNIGELFKLHYTAPTITFPFEDGEKWKIPQPLVRDTGASLELDSVEETESGITQKFLDSEQQHFTSPFYDEEDLLDWDAAIITPPPRPSGTIRVKLKYKGRSKPFPIENFWEE